MSVLSMGDLKAIVDFFNLESLLIIAEELKLKGLTSDESSVVIKTEQANDNIEDRSTNNQAQLTPKKEKT